MLVLPCFFVQKYINLLKQFGWLRDILVESLSDKITLFSSSHGTYILDGSSEHNAQVWRKTGITREYLRFDNCFDVSMP